MVTEHRLERRGKRQSLSGAIRTDACSIFVISAAVVYNEVSLNWEASFQSGRWCELRVEKAGKR